MPLYTRSGGLLTRSGSLADNAACCCGTVFSNCCSGAAVQIPSSISISLTLGTRVAGFIPTSCTQAEAHSILNGTYVCPYDAAFSATGRANYRLVITGGVIGADWYCVGNNSFGTLFRMSISLRYCSLSPNCYQQANWDFYFGTGTGFGGATAPSLCSITTGDTSAISSSTAATGQSQLNFQASLGSCGGGGGSADAYPVSLSVTPTW
jgi:hypothetical protein